MTMDDAGTGLDLNFQETDKLILRNVDTGNVITVKKSSDLNKLRRRVKLAEIPSRKIEEEKIIIDLDKKTYKLNSYPPLAYVFYNLDWKYRVFFVIALSLLLAGAAQLQFYFPCLGDTTTVAMRNAQYCVSNSIIGNSTLVNTCTSPACVQKIPVTMQTYMVLLNGSIGGRLGALGTFLYVVMVTLGAPFGANGAASPVWLKGSLLGPTGGFLASFPVASYIMGVCSEKGQDRPRSFYYIIPYMILAEVVIYMFGMFWGIFGISIQNNIPLDVLCPSSKGASGCLYFIANTFFIPFLPGDAVKMLMVVITVPLLWQLILLCRKFYFRYQMKRAHEERFHTSASTNVSSNPAIINLDDESDTEGI
jgi:biotin transport system substrate-specific component